MDLLGTSVELGGLYQKWENPVHAHIHICDKTNIPTAWLTLECMSRGSIRLFRQGWYILKTKQSGILVYLIFLFLSALNKLLRNEWLEFFLTPLDVKCASEHVHIRLYMAICMCVCACIPGCEKTSLTRRTCMNINVHVELYNTCMGKYAPDCGSVCVCVRVCTCVSAEEITISI